MFQLCGSHELLDSHLDGGHHEWPRRSNLQRPCWTSHVLFTCSLDAAEISRLLYTRGRLGLNPYLPILKVESLSWHLIVDYSNFQSIFPSFKYLGYGIFPYCYIFLLSLLLRKRFISTPVDMEVVKFGRLGTSGLYWFFCVQIHFFFKPRLRTLRSRFVSTWRD